MEIKQVFAISSATVNLLKSLVVDKIEIINKKLVDATPDIIKECHNELALLESSLKLFK